MKKILISIIMCLVAIAAISQKVAQIEVSYDFNRPDTKDNITTTKMLLLASSDEAKYFNNTSLWVDSMKSTPEGKEKYMEIIKKTCLTIEPDGTMSWDLRKGPTKTINTFVFTDLPNETVTHYDKYGDDPGFYSEPIGEIEWTFVEDSTATVLGYECLMAECDYHGRHWKAWFAPDIPLLFGPWKLRGLPGLILRAEASGNFSFVATGIEQSTRVISPMYFKESYSKIDRKKALENAEHYRNNMAGMMNAQGQNVTVYSLDENGNKTELPRYDGLKHSLEPDYKIK